VCHHLLVVEKADQKIVGTYRMQTAEMAARAGGFYSADEFQIDQLPRDVLADAVELGRACIAREHRNRRVLFLLWRGLALYLSTFKKRYLFGCCSLTSQDPAAGLVLLRQLEERCVLHPEYVVAPIAGLECVCSDEDRRRCGPVELPTLFEMYLRYGALVCGSPAIDRRFKTIDYLVLLDVEDLDPQTYALFAG